MNQEFQNREDCRSQLQMALAIPSDADDVAHGILDAFADSCEEVTAAPSQPGFGMRIRRWVIRDEDLKLFETVKDAVVPLAAVGFIFASLPIGSVVAIVFALIGLLRNASRSGAKVSVPQVQILAVLEQTKHPLTVKEILQRLPINSEDSWDEQRVLMELRDLKEVVTKKGKVAFVDEKSDGHWFLAGV